MNEFMKERMEDWGPTEEKKEKDRRRERMCTKKRNVKKETHPSVDCQTQKSEAHDATSGNKCGRP